ncbi:MAG: hypothetical protein A2V77_25055 [Anaeromyxobacter sp. RBG_16_69_14]|nr:MAG: hypothetical protein A2V77_25055 [Anaeromyxobacter sp. RBG_16_69_14]
MSTRGSDADAAAAGLAAGFAPPSGKGERYCAISAIVEIGTQSAMPGRQASVSGPISPDSQRAFTPGAGSGPTWLSAMATYQSLTPSAPPPSCALPADDSCGAGASPALSAAAAAAAAIPGEPPPKTLSKASPSSRSSVFSWSPSAWGSGVGGGAASISGATVGARFTETMFPHFLQRTLTPSGPTFSSEIMYCAPQLSQENLIASLNVPHELPSSWLERRGGRVSKRKTF